MAPSLVLRQILRIANNFMAESQGQSGCRSAARKSTLTSVLPVFRNYLSEAIGKLGVGNRIEAYRLARQKGWL